MVDYFELPDYLLISDVAVEPKVDRAGEASGKVINYMGAGLPVVCFEGKNKTLVLFLSGTLKHIMKCKVLILYDFGLEQLSDIARLTLLEILEDRHLRKSTIVISQLPVSAWHQIIGEPTIAAVIMDRMAFNSHIIELKGDLVRRKMYGID